MRSEAPEDSAIRLFEPVHWILENPPKSENCRAICCPWKSNFVAQQSAPTAGSQGKTDHTPK
jgi:hypothetical protein